ncbi:MAG: ArsB/NhaD family transporter [Chloroflexi bacterium]|nr:ArsB/NhaD family transporter [Chloroflexota bacterium]
MDEAIALLIFGITLIGLFLERWHRVVVSGLGASLMVALGRSMGFYGEEHAFETVEFETLGLLLGMMMLVSQLQHTGFFSYIAIRVAKNSGGSVGRLLLMLGITTSVLSMFLDNVTTVILMAPVVVLISELMGVSPIPLLISQAIFSNTGGMATLVGDPPNILIGAASELTFLDFLIHMGPMVLVIWIATYLSLRYLFRRQLAESPPTGKEALAHLNADEALTDPIAARRILIVMAGVVVAFFLESVLNITPAFAAVTGAGVAFAWTQKDVNAALREVEWDVLLFFTALFIMVGGLEAAGVMEIIAESLVGLRDLSPVLMGLLVLWSMVVLSALIDNVPITIAVIPIVLQLGQQGIDIQPIWWAIALGVGLGGNATPIGSTANIVVISISERTDYRITAQLWLKEGMPTVAIATTVASILYVLLFDFLSAG